MKGLVSGDWTVDWRWAVTTGAHTLSSPSPPLSICNDDKTLLSVSLLPAGDCSHSLHLLPPAALARGPTTTLTTRVLLTGKVMDLEFPNPAVESLETN